MMMGGAPYQHHPMYAMQPMYGQQQQQHYHQQNAMFGGMPHQMPPPPQQQQMPPPQPQPQHQQQRPPMVARVRVIRIDVKLLLKLALIIFLFNQDGNSTRLTLMIGCAVVYYLYQMGAFGGWINVNINGNNVNGNNNNNGGVGGNRNVGGNENNNLDAGVAAAIEEIERNNMNNQRLEFLSNFLLRQPPGIRRELQTFLIGFFGSLLPSWNAPNLVEAAVRARRTDNNGAAAPSVTGDDETNDTEGASSTDPLSGGPASASETEESAARALDDRLAAVPMRVRRRLGKSASGEDEGVAVGGDAPADTSSSVAGGVDDGASASAGQRSSSPSPSASHLHTD